MPGRNRARIGQLTGYRKNNNGGAIVSFTALSLDEVTNDVTGPGDNAPFSVKRITRSGGLVNGRQSSNLTGYEYFNCPCGVQAGPDSYYTSHASLPTYNPGLLASEVLSRTNPSRPSAQILVTGAELRELPGLAKELLRIRSGNLRKFFDLNHWRKLGVVAKRNLMIQFGILPIISDLDVLLTFQSLVDQRVRELERLKTRGLRRTIQLRSDSVSTKILNQTIQSSPSLHADVSKTTSKIIKGHVRWHVTRNFELADESMRAMARKIIMGNQLDHMTLYELMPWSWLIDYFTNLGNLVSSTRNLLDVGHGSVRIMTHTRTEVATSNHDWGNGAGGTRITCTEIRNSREDKTRDLASPTLAAKTDLLTPGQTSILGSLAAIRLR
jgi:hypothetical protein